MFHALKQDNFKYIQDEVPLFPSNVTPVELMNYVAGIDISHPKLMLTSILKRLNTCAINVPRDDWNVARVTDCDILLEIRENYTFA